MGNQQTSIIPFRILAATAWIKAYQEEIWQGRREATIAIYTPILEKFAEWLSLRSGNAGGFRPEAITHMAIESFLETLPSFSYKKQARAALPGSCRWLPNQGRQPFKRRFATREVSREQVKEKLKLLRG